MSPSTDGWPEFAEGHTAKWETRQHWVRKNDKAKSLVSDIRDIFSSTMSKTPEPGALSSLTKMAVRISRCSHVASDRC